MIIHAKNVYIGGQDAKPKKKGLLSRALKKDDAEDEDTPVTRKLSDIAELLKTKRSSTSHLGGG